MKDGREKSPYEDIIDLPHPELKRHPRMPHDKRAAQFAPFAALTGYEDAIEKTAAHQTEAMERHPGEPYEDE